MPTSSSELISCHCPPTRGPLTAPGHLWAPSGLHPRAATPAGLGHPCPKTRPPLQPCSQTLSMSPLPLPAPPPPSRWSMVTPGHGGGSQTLSMSPCPSLHRPPPSRWSMVTPGHGGGSAPSSVPLSPLESKQGSWFCPLCVPRAQTGACWLGALRICERVVTTGTRGCL